jgi:GT2 family glycosyltransferase
MRHSKTSFTVVVPTCNRPQALARCLRGIGAEADVIVSDDSPGNETRDVVARDFPGMRWTQGPRRGPAANRNHGAAFATGEWVVFLDDDVEPQPGWFAALVSAADDTLDVVEGKTTCPAKRDHPLEEYVENIEGGNFWSCNLAMRRAVFEELGGFDEDFTEAAGEDMEMAWRIRQRRLRTAFAPGMEVVHPVRRASLRQLLRRTLMYRWMPLYRLKTGDALPLGSSAWRVATSLGWREIVGMLRLTAQLFTRPGAQPLTRVFNVAWRWLTLPLVLPWQLVWELHFRARLAGRAARNPDSR